MPAFICDKEILSRRIKIEKIFMDNSLSSDAKTKEIVAIFNSLECEAKLPEVLCFYGLNHSQGDFLNFWDQLSIGASIEVVPLSSFKNLNEFMLVVYRFKLKETSREVPHDLENIIKDLDLKIKLRIH